MSRLSALVGAACLLAFGMAPAALADVDCTAPTELIEDDPRLPHTQAVLKARQTLKIVALGGASTAGTAAGDPQKSWPARLGEEITKRWPGVSVEIVNKGIPRQTTPEMVERLQADVFAERPVLLIWETGINDAVRGDDVEQFNDALKTGLDRIKAERIETMLMDMQFSRGTAALINFDRYLEALRRTADLNDVYLFRRYDIMRYWSEHGVFNFDDVPKAERAALAIRVYDCLAQRLADAIAYATR